MDHKASPPKPDLERLFSIPAFGVVFASAGAMLGSAVGGPAGGLVGMTVGAVSGVITEISSQKRHAREK